MTGKDFFLRTCKLPASAEDAYRWHMRDGAFWRLAPPWEDMEFVGGNSILEDGAVMTFKVKQGPIQIEWRALHKEFIEGREFTDIQEKGPFASWKHRHRMTDTRGGGSVLEDMIDYSLPLPLAINPIATWMVHEKLERMFDYRHAIMQQDLKVFERFKTTKRLKVLVTGASGLIGKQLVPFLSTQGHEVLTAVRSKNQAKDNKSVYWNPESGEIDSSKLEELDAVIHLAGENLASARWTEQKKSRIRGSRVKATTLLADALGKLSKPPGVLVCASATGYYGDRQDERLDESSSAGKGFLAELCKDWENASSIAAEKGIRVVNLRIGIVLSPKGGALKMMLPPFLLGGGGSIGSGKQSLSWISIDDLVRAIHHAMMTESVCGPVNLVSPIPVTSTEFAAALGKVLSRPAAFPVTDFAAKLIFGEMAEELLLSSSFVSPKKLLESGFEFCQPELKQCLRFLLGKKSATPKPEFKEQDSFAR